MDSSIVTQRGFMKDIGLETRKKDKVQCTMSVGMFMKVNGNEEPSMVQEHSMLLLVLWKNMKELGKMECIMVKEFFIIVLELGLKDIGKKESEMEKQLCLLGLQNFKVCATMALWEVMVNNPISWLFLIFLYFILTFKQINIQ